MADAGLWVCPILVDEVMAVCSGGKGLVLYSTNYYYYYYYCVHQAFTVMMVILLNVPNKRPTISNMLLKSLLEIWLYTLVSW